MKLFNKKDIFTIIDIEEAEMYLNSKGYFGDSIKELNDNIKQGFVYELEEISHNDDDVFVYKSKGQSDYNSLFLPIEKVKMVKEPKWREFRTFEEFFLVVGSLGCHVRYRQKDDISNEFLSVVNSFNYKARTFTIGAHIYGFNELFTRYEFYQNQKWQPFGVRE